MLSQRPRLKSRSLQKLALTSFSQGQQWLSGYVKQKRSKTHLEMHTSFKLWNEEVKQAEGLWQCFFDMPLFNIGEVHITPARGERFL